MDSITLERFMKFVEKTDSCWNWTGCKVRGYGQFNINRKMYKPHRLMLEHHLGRPITEGMVVAHTPIICHNRVCVNPEHLREATRLENTQDKKIDGTDNIGSKNGRTKLTEEQVIAIRADNRTYREIATDYGVHYAHISQIKLRKTWKHI